jgi:superfamily II DNA or RNA helicase
VKLKERDQAFESFRQHEIHILLCTQLGDEGIDIPRLEELILSFPGRSRTKVIQRVGRLQRIFSGKLHARAWDLVDWRISATMRQYHTRKKIYREKGFKLHKPVIVMPKQTAVP